MIACVNAIRHGIVPPTIGYSTPDPECDLDITANAARERPVGVAMSNAFAFGGMNAVIALSAI
jgi:nodulation protein E